MADDTDTPVDIEDNLEDFEADFFQMKAPEEKVEEPVVENEDEPLATDEDENEDDAEDGDEPDDAEDEEEEEELPKPHRNRKSAKERIEELVAKQRETERSASMREAELLRRLETVEARVKSEAEDKTKDVRAFLPPEAPSPDATTEDGKPLYELGEFDPKFIRDLTKFTIEQETKAARAQEEQRRQQENTARAQKEIADAWIDRVDEVEQEIPELRDNMKTLTDTFQNIDPNYGEYLASTIMISEVGPQIMNYLSQNIGEAQKIVASGPAAATLALGRLEAMLLKVPEPKEKRNTKSVSKAPEPPEERVKGRGNRFNVAPDTDDLNAFERAFFN